ncbi:MAG: glycosyltransferase family 2 protein [Eubacteriales bacterium]
MVKVSICIPTYNNVEEVKRLVASISVQTYTDYEVIITDDSTNTEIQEYIESANSSIRYYHNEKPLGHIFNWNKAISYANGEFVKIMFSDDWFTKETSLGELVALLEENPKASLAFSGNLQVSKKETVDRAASHEYLEKLRDNYRYLFISNQIGAPSNTLYRRKDENKFSPSASVISPLQASEIASLKSRFMFDPKSNWASDVFLYFEILKENPVFVDTKEPLISIGIHENQYTEMFSQKDNRIYKDYEYMFQKYHLIEDLECSQHFLQAYLLKFHKGLLTAKKNGYPIGFYLPKYIAFMWRDMVCSYGKALIRKIIKK